MLLLLGFWPRNRTTIYNIASWNWNSKPNWKLIWGPQHICKIGISCRICSKPDRPVTKNLEGPGLEVERGGNRVEELGGKNFRKIGRTIRRIRRLTKSKQLRLNKGTQKAMKFLRHKEKDYISTTQEWRKKTQHGEKETFILP